LQQPPSSLAPASTMVSALVSRLPSPPHLLVVAFLTHSFHTFFVTEWFGS
jgi:hypothetical protein